MPANSSSLEPTIPGEEDFPGEAVPKDPQHLMADVRLEAIQGQDDPALGLGDALQAGGISEGEGEQFVVRGRPVQQVLPYTQMAVKHRPRQVRPVSAGAELHSEPGEPLATQMGDQSLQRDEVVQSPVAQIGKRKTATRLIGRSLSSYQIACEIGEVPARQKERGIVG